MERERDFDAETLVDDWDDDFVQRLGVTIGAWTFCERTRTSNSPNVLSRRHCRTSLRSNRHPLLVRVLQTVQMSIPRRQTRTSARPKDTRARARTSNTPNVHSWRHTRTSLVPRTPVLVRVLQTLQMSIPGGTRARLTFQGHPFSCAYFKHSKCPFQAASLHVHSSKDTLARARTSNTPTVHSRRQVAHAHSFQGHPCSWAYFNDTPNVHSRQQTRTSPRPTHTLARARTSNNPNFHSWRQTRTSTSSHGASCSCKNCKHPWSCMRVARTHAPAKHRKKLSLSQNSPPPQIRSQSTPSRLKSCKNDTTPHPTHRRRARVHR